MWKCPECENEIEELFYNCYTSGSESGSAYLSKEKEEDRWNIVTDHECSDSETNDTSDYEYTCPECDSNIEPSELIWGNEEEEEEEKQEEPEETKHNIIKPTNEIIRIEQNMKNATNFMMICKMCFHVFIYDDPYGSEKDLHECIQCGYENTVKEYNELLNKGYFNEKHKIKH